MKRTRRNNLRKRLSRTFMRRFTSCVAMLVVFTTTYMLILPAVAIDQNTAEETPGVYLPSVLQYACAWQEHTHTDDCYIEKDILDAQGLPTGEKEKILVCGREDWTVHEHSDSCYQDGVLVCTLPEHPRHEHNEDCYETRRELICTQEEHVHTDACYEEVQTGTERTLVCGYTEGEVISPEVWSDPVYSEPVYNEAGELLEDSVLLEEAVLLQEEEVHHHTEDCYAETPVYAQQLTCGQAEHVHTDACWQEEKVLTCTKQELHTHTEACYEKGPEGESPIEMGWAWYVEENGQQILLGDPAHRICGKTELLEHVHSDACFRMEGQNAEEAENAEDKKTPEDQENEEDADFSKTMPAQTFHEATETMQVSVTAEEGTFPAGTTMKVEDVEDDEVISSICDAATGDENSIVKVRATDITFYTEAGEPIEPKKPVKVVMTPVEEEEEDLGKATVEVVHVSQDGDAAIVEQAEADEEKEEISGNNVTFEADAFSVYALVYTVDFHWEVDGRTYKISIPGGGFISFEQLVEVLGISKVANVEQSQNQKVFETDENEVENFAGEETEESSFASSAKTALTLNDVIISDITKEFAADVTNLEFSSPSLVDVSFVEADTTVGQIKDSRQLDVQYSAELTEEQIAEFNSQTVEAGDWALISMQPFTSEESLTVTMKTGEVFAIKVTDAMDPTAPYSQGTTFTAYDTRTDGFTINLFDYGPESDLDNGNNNLKDKGSQYNSGINYNHTLKFTAYGKKPSEVQTNGQNVLTQNHFSGTDAATQGIVDRNLSGGYPQLSGGGESLAYLFNTTSDGNNKKVYKDVSGLFQKDADGKYYYDSNVNYAYYNPNQGNGGDFVLCDTFPEEGSDWGVGFFPFNPWTGEHTCIHWNGWCPPRNGSNQNAGWAAQGGDGKYHSEYYYNHHFGMTLEGTFQLTPDGKLNDKDLVFNFSGDDDLWVYIDDVLVLDIGGIHNPVHGSINFRTGNVEVDSAYQVNSVINDSQRGPEADTTIAQAFAAAGKTWNNEPYAEHTIKVFYVERGGCYSNCQMEFNLTRFKDVEFDKKDQYGDPIENAEFKLFKEDGTPLIETYIDHDDNDTVKYRDYVRNSDEDGHIKFDHVPVGTYYIRETDVPEGYIKDEAVYTAKIIVERNDDGTYSVHSYVLRNGAQTDRVRNIKQADITLALDKKWKLGETEVNPTSASASFQLMRVKIVEEQTTVPGTKTPAVVKLQDKSGTSLCSSINVNVGDTIRISYYLLNVDNYPWNATDTIVTASGEEIGSLHSWNNYGNKQSEGPIDYTIKESDVVNGEVVLKTKEKNSSDFTTKPQLSRYSEGPEPAPVTVIVETPVTEAIETFSLPEDSSWAKSFTKPVYDEHGRKYTYYFVETSNSEGTAPVYVDGNGQVITDPAGLATSENLTQTIINNIEYGSIEITKNLLKNGNESSLTGTFYYAVYAAADVEDGVPKTGAQAAITGSITVSENDNGTNSDTIRVPIGTYYVYELTGEGGQPILEPSRQRIGERTYQVTGSGTSTEVGLTDGSAVFTNNYETVDKTATKSWSDNTDHPTIYFKLFYISRGHDEEHGSVIEFVEVDGAEIKELSSGITEVTWEDLPKYDANGEEYTYIVKEYIKVDGEYVAAAPDGYVKSENGLTVNNTKSEGYNPKTTYIGTKTWEDTANNGATRPDSIHVDLYANGVKLENCTAQWTKGTGNDANVWTYTFSDLPVFDENGVYISYYAVETPVSGYDPGQTTPQPTIYQVISGSVDGNIERVTTCSSLDITLDAETDLAYVVIKKSAKRHLIWTQRAISRAEKNKIYEDINKVSGFINELTDSTVEFVSGLPVETEFFKGTVTVTKKSDKVMHVEFANHQTWAQLCYGSYKYTYDPGRTDFVNSLITTEVNAMKVWIDSTGEPMTPAEGTTVTFNLYADDVDLNKPVVLNGKSDVVVLSEDSEEAETQEVNEDAVTANAYEKEAWKAYWGNLPTHNAAGEEITYTVMEIAVPGYENINPDGVSSGGTITNKQIVTEIHILKEKADGQPLTGAKFRLDQYDADRNEVIKTWGPMEVSSEQGKEGTLSFEGLGVGKYTLVEAEVPTGYVKISEDPEFEVVPDEDGTLKVQFSNTDEVTYDNDNSTFHVINVPGAALPSTGGPGTTALYLLGIMLTGLAGAGLVMRKRRRVAV